MDFNKLIKDYWHVISSVIITAFIVGIYYMKIEYLSQTISNNTADIASIKKDTYFILGILQNDYPGINIRKYAKSAQSNNISAQETANDLKKLKNFTPVVGKTYLIRKGFSKDQAEAIYYKTGF